MTRILVLWFIVVIAARAQSSAVFAVQENGPRSERINIVFLSEGYTTADMPKFATDVGNAVNFLFSKEPWAQYRSYCNVYRIEVASNESGCDNGATSGAGGVRDTYFNAGFNTPSVTQLLTLGLGGSTKAYALLNTHVPEYDLPIVIVNDSKYGGAGGTIAVASAHSQSAAVVEHEIGHSFALLADEYDTEYLIYTPAEKPNTTAETNRSLIRWKHWIDDTTPVPTPETSTYDSLAGLFEGSMYRTTGWFRPHNNSLMRSLNRPCGQINREQFVLQFYSRVQPIDGYSPATTSLSVTAPSNLTFSVTPKVPTSGPALSVTWKIDGVTQSGQTAASLSTWSDAIGNGNHTVSAVVQDPTAFVRLDASNLLRSTTTWSVTLSGQVPATLASWRTTYGADTAVVSSDGLPNLVKYALGCAADVAVPSDQALSTAVSGDYLTLTVPRRLRRSDVNCVVQVSSDLVNWNSGPGYTVTVQDSDTMLVVRDATPIGASPARFMRLAVEVIP